METNEGIKVFDWDDELNDDGEGNTETVVLPNGTYPFEVVKVERQWFNGSTRLPECNRTSALNYRTTEMRSTPIYIFLQALITPRERLQAVPL